MASRKLLGNLLLSSRSRYRHHLLTPQQVSTACTRLRLVPKYGGCGGYRQFGDLIEQWEKAKDQAHRICLQYYVKRVEWIRGALQYYVKRVEWMRGVYEKKGISGFGQEVSEKSKVVSERLDELKGLAKDLVELSSSSREFKFRQTQLTKKGEEVQEAMKDLMISLKKHLKEMLYNQDG